MHTHTVEADEPILLVPGLFVAAVSVAAWVNLKSLAYARPFGVSEAESLMTFSKLGALRCNCEPTDPTQICNDRRQSCRACGCAIVDNDPARLYQELSVREINAMTQGLRRIAIDAAGQTVEEALPSTADTLAATHIN